MFSSTCLPEGGEDLVVDVLQHVLRRVELDEEHDEDAVVGHLLELSATHLVVLQQHARHDTQYLQHDR